MIFFLVQHDNFLNTFTLFLYLNHAFFQILIFIKMHNLNIQKKILMKSPYMYGNTEYGKPCYNNVIFKIYLLLLIY